MRLDHGAPLLDPSLLAGLTAAEKEEALAAAAAARRAEEKAEQRALERAMAQKAAARQREQQQLPTLASSHHNSTSSTTTTTTTTTNPRIKFVSKRQRQQQQQPPPQDQGIPPPSGQALNGATLSGSSVQRASSTTTAKASAVARPPAAFAARTYLGGGGREGKTLSASAAAWMDKERQAIRATYLGKTADQTSGGTDPPNTSKQGNQKSPKKKKKKALGKKATFRFEWDNTDDTLDATDPLYAGMGSLPRKRPRTTKGHRPHHQDEDDLLDARTGASWTASSVQTKPLDQMTARDWRIFRENYEIVVKGGKAPPPLRTFREGNFHPSLLNAIENVMHYKEPTPIQRQSIPIGLQRRDLIGIAETGSGKTAAFGVPLLQYIMQLPSTILARVAEEGPLALVLAPTRELALQIHGEFQKLLSRQHALQAAAIVGGQSIQHQAQELRDGVHVVVGTPGRINDCIEMAYMVLNQCCYIVLDEADRMVDMGFAPQMESILDSMGGLLKSEDEAEAYAQEEQDRMKLSDGLPKHRLTAMFSATMPLEVERMAKRYLRHPAVISIGDQDSSKNTRIVQKILFLSSPAQKERALKDLILNPRFLREKVIVFVNEKKHADGVGRMIERIGRPCVVLHGGKNQDQREENLAAFRQGGVVLVATDVAGRGLDIPNVAHVINYDLPSRSIDSYNHRIGRTGRAGKEGYATSLLTDQDEGIMAPLKQYLESTGQPVPDKLARHPAAQANSGHGHLIY